MPSSERMEGQAEDREQETGSDVFFSGSDVSAPNSTSTL